MDMQAKYEKLISDLTNLEQEIWVKSQELSKEHFDESKLDMWDDDEAFGQFTAYSECREKIFEMLHKIPEYKNIIGGIIAKEI